MYEYSEIKMPDEKYMVSNKPKEYKSPSPSSQCQNCMRKDRMNNILFLILVLLFLYSR